MLIKCPECNLQISDKAIACPHCGYPLKPEKAVRTTPRKRMRLPNGFGQITEIKGRNLRNPWRVLVTVGKNQFGRPIQKALRPKAYFKTYNEAYEALLKYHQSPINLTKEMTIKELYDKWSEERFDEISVKSQEKLKSAWKWCHSVYDLKVTDLDKNILRNLYEYAVLEKKSGEQHPSPQTKQVMKQILSQMLDYAMEYDIVNDNVARKVALSRSVMKDASETKKSHIAFTSDEMDALWKNTSNPIARMVLVDCYMGWRPQELCTLKKSDVNITDMTITAGMKTDAGRERLVPIHSKIANIILDFYNDDESEYLFPKQYFNYNRYSYYFGKLIKELGLNPEHRPHDSRKTFVTMAKMSGMDEYALKRMVGHEIDDITEKIYTQRPISWYKEEIEKIKEM